MTLTPPIIALAVFLGLVAVGLVVLIALALGRAAARASAMQSRLFEAHHAKAERKREREQK
jgi:cytochrome c-type biogenesis protein CcmH/NrfF